MTYGFNPVLPGDDGSRRAGRSSRTSRDGRVYGVTGDGLIGVARSGRPPGGIARGVSADVRQRGFKFGSGSRTSWFAPGVGLVKLVFRHADGSTSTVQRIGR